MPSLFSRIRTRGRSVESRQTPPSQQSKPSRQSPQQQAQTQQQPQNPTHSTPHPPRSVSVPPQRSPPSGGRSVTSKASLGSRSTAKNSTVSGSKSKTSSVAASTSTSTPAPRMPLTYDSYDGEARDANGTNKGGVVGGRRRSSDTNHHHHSTANHARYTFAEPSPPTAPPTTNHDLPSSSPKRLGYESDGNTSFLSGETSDGEFITALDRSPPKLDDMFLAEGMFGRLLVDTSTNRGGGRPDQEEFEDPPEILASLEEDEYVSEIVSGSGLSREEEHSSNLENRSMVLVKEEEFRSGEWIAFDRTKEEDGVMPSPLRPGSKQSRSNSQPQKQPQQPQMTGEWETPPTRYTKNPRLVSPSPSQPTKVHDDKSFVSSPLDVQTSSSVGGSPNDDLRAWGMMQDQFESPTPSSSRQAPKPVAATTNGGSSSNAFGADFFSNGFSLRFEAEDDDDAFFESGWTDLKSAAHGNAKKVGKNTNNVFNNQGDNANVTLWEGNVTSFAKPKQSQFFEEKKDDMVWTLPSHLTGKDISKDSSAFTKETNSPFQNSPLRNSTSVDPESVSSGSNDNKVVVSFETFDGLQTNVSSSSSSRKVPPTPLPTNNGQGNTNPARTQPTRHRRVPSNGSTNSQQQLQRSQNRKKGGGSVGSNSSAVDQILEQYRQKRLAKQQQQQPPQSENGASGGGQSSSHNPIPTNHNLRRSPSSESLSRTIGNLEKSIAAKNSPGSVGAGIPPSRAHQQPPQPPQYSQGMSPSTGRASPQSSITYSRVSSGANYQPSLNASASEISDRIRIHRRGIGTASTEEICPANPSSDSDQFLLANIEATIGPRGVAPDMESLSGRSNRSSQYRHGRSSPRSHMHRPRGDAASVDSRTSRNSFRSYRSNISASALSNMSKESQSVATDLFRLEAQLAEVARQQEQPLEISTDESFARDAVYGSVSEGSMRSNNGITIIGAEPVPRPSLVEVIAPPGKLGILLANKTGEKGPTHVSAVRSESVLAGKVHVGDRFVSIDGEDVSGMNSREITAVMARKADSQRVIVFVPVRMNNKAQDWI